MMKQLKEVQVTKIVDIIQKNCPRAFAKKEKSDNYEILVDNISKQCYESIVNFV